MRATRRAPIARNADTAAKQLRVTRTPLVFVSSRALSAAAGRLVRKPNPDDFKMGVVRIAFYLGNRLLRDSNWQYEKILPRRDRKFYLAVTVIVVVVHELTYPAGRLCDVILWPLGPIVVTVVVNPALLQIDLARFNRTPIKLGTVHCEIGVGVGVAAGVGVGVAVGAGVGVDVGLGVGVGV